MFSLVNISLGYYRKQFEVCVYDCMFNATVRSQTNGLLSDLIQRKGNGNDITSGEQITIVNVSK